MGPDELLIAVAALAASGLAYLSFGRWRDRSGDTGEAAPQEYGGFVAYRARVLLAMSRLSREELVRTAARNDALNADLRRSCLDIMNRHESICSLYNKGLMDDAIFDEDLRDMIVADQDALAEFFELVYEDQLARGLKEQLPLYPEIAKMRHGTAGAKDPAGQPPRAR